MSSLIYRVYSDYIYSSANQGINVSVTDFHQAVVETIKKHMDCRKYFSERGCAYNSTLETYKVNTR